MLKRVLLLALIPFAVAAESADSGEDGDDDGAQPMVEQAEAASKFRRGDGHKRSERRKRVEQETSDWIEKIEADEVERRAKLKQDRR